MAMYGSDAFVLSCDHIEMTIGANILQETMITKYIEENYKAVPSGDYNNECMICMMSLSRSGWCCACNVCKKQYHKGCLKEWASVNLSCPSCRS